MAFISTNPNPYILNLPSLQNVVTSATGNVNDLNTYTASLQNYINVTSGTLSINTISAKTSTAPYITVSKNLNLSNGSLYINGSNILTSNTLNGTNYLAFQVGAIERARISGSDLGIGTTTPLAKLDVNGSQLIRGSLYISSMGVVPTSTLGNLYADGDLFATGIKYPSDPILKTDVRELVGQGLPEAVRFRWKSNNEEDIGVLATDVLNLEPVCVQKTKNGTLTVDYPKLVVLCIAEIKTLKARVAMLEARP
jgi:hypothetical protein